MPKIKFKFKNGIKVRDLVSGLEGIIDCSSIWLNGCIRYSVQPKSKEGENVKVDSYWVDEQQIVKIDNGIVKEIKPDDTGGPTSVSSGANLNQPK